MKLIPCAAALLAAILAGCANKPDLVAPEVLVSPYSPATSNVVWAVAPLANESGTSAVDSMMVTDAIVARAAEIRGIATLPLNRTLAAMRALRMPAVRSPADARRLADALGADAIIVGSITAYDPYDPPKIGLMLGIYSRQREAKGMLDPRALQASPTDKTPLAMSDDPSSIINEHLDAQNHEVLNNLRRYAQGRHDPDSAMGWKRYTASMELYAEFAAYWSVYRLLQEEQLRVTRSSIALARSSR